MMEGVRMNKRFFSAENIATISLYMFCVPLMLIIIGNEFNSLQEPNWLIVSIGSIIVAALTLLYIKLLSNEWKDSKVEPYFEPKKIDKTLQILLLLSMCIEGVIFSVYAVMFMMPFNQEPPYPYRWTDILMFWALLASLVLGLTALIKSMRTPKNSVRK